MTCGRQRTNDGPAMISPPNCELPNPFLSGDGTLVCSSLAWGERRREIHRLMVPLVYGDLPAAPAHTRCVVLHEAVVRRFGGARALSCRIEVDGGHGFMLRVLVPGQTGPLPVLVDGDGCWHYASDEVVTAILERGNVFAQFNRVELGSDMPGGEAGTTSGRFFPGRHCAALAAWAWGYHRVIDALFQLDFVDRGRIAVVGHSRGGKSALLAGAMDERIALTSANNSGACGAGCLRWLGPGAETLADVVGAFPHWFGPRLAQFAGRENELPFDQHFLKALIAPRALLTTEALGDHWANPMGAWQSHRAAREVYAFLGAPQAIATAYREGGHEHNLADWRTLLDFCDVVFRGKARADVLELNPFAGLAAPAGWCGASRTE